MGMVFCRGCGKQLHESAPTCPHCGAPQSINNVKTLESTIPEGIKGWSWGAFLLNWIWAIGNKTWIGLLALVPYFGFIMVIILGIKGREWAWKNNQWESVDHFNRVQEKWSFWGLMLLALTTTAIAVAAAIIFGIPAYQDYQSKHQNNDVIEREEANPAEPEAELHKQAEQKVPDNQVAAIASHCTSDERIVYSCSVGKKVASICASRDAAMDKGYVQYRFGVIGNPEMIFPYQKQPANNKFSFTNEVFSGGIVVTTISFQNGSYTYSASTRFDHGHDLGEIDVENSGKSIATLPCMDTPVGNEDLIALGMKKIEID